jgi:hypothetical protein
MPFDLDMTTSISYKTAEAAGAARLLTLMLEGKFGRLPDAICQRVAHVSFEQIESWGVRGFKASSLEEVFVDQSE